MKQILVFLFFKTAVLLSCNAQPTDIMEGNMSIAAVKFLQSLSADQKEKVQFTFDNEERFNWHFVPISRKGLPLKEMTAAQRKTVLDLLHMVLSDSGFNKATSIMALENILKEVENRPANDKYRDAENYYISIFGNPAVDSIWSWRFEGHHVAFNFAVEKNLLIAATPGFLGTNPAIVLSGPEKGKQVLKDETELGFALLNSLDAKQLTKAIIADTALKEIITFDNRKAIINDQKGILYSELNIHQQKIFIQLLSIYINRYTRFFALGMMKEIEAAGLNNLRFAWAGDRQSAIGHPHYYRIQGPTIIIEYDNTQNNANHVHSVIRDLKNDFGGDELLEHYNKVRH